MHKGIPVVGGPVTDLLEKTDRYEAQLADAMVAVDPVPPAGTPLAQAADACEEMAGSYLADGRHFRSDDDPVNALAAFAYGHAWLDAGARIGLFDVAAEEHLFTVRGGPADG